MRNLFIVGALLLFVGCGGNKTPDVSNINVPLTVYRFEQAFFTPDTTVNLLTTLRKTEPDFTGLFLQEMIAVQDDSATDATMMTTINQFKRGLYKTVYDSTQKLYANFEPTLAQIKSTLQFTKHYFPKYALPTKIITYVGPLDGYTDILAENIIGIGLHHHLGSGSNFYQIDAVQSIYPSYISQGFTQQSIAINLAKNIINDLYPEQPDDKTLIQNMLEKGKRLYALSLLCPNTPPHLLINYTKAQYTDCQDHQANIWNFFTQAELLQTLEPSLQRKYIFESANTQELGAAAPGNLGSFIGWQIIQQYMANNSGTSLPTLFTTDNNQILTQTKYKP
jgi:hypothetical protein